MNVCTFQCGVVVSAAVVCNFRSTETRGVKIRNKTLRYAEKRPSCQALHWKKYILLTVFTNKTPAPRLKNTAAMLCLHKFCKRVNAHCNNKSERRHFINSALVDGLYSDFNNMLILVQSPSGQCKNATFHVVKNLSCLL